MAKTRAVLIIGGSGYIGTHLALKLREGYKVFATYHKHKLEIPGVSFFPLNVHDRTGIRRIVYTTQPDVIIYAAGSNNLDWAEAEPRDAERVHTGGPATVSNVSEILQPKFIFLSNCFVFDGHRGNYHETDTVLPASIMGKVKVGGENFIRGKSLNYVIVRSSPLFGRGNGTSLTFLDHLRMKLDLGERVELPASMLHSFAPIGGFIDLIAKLVDSGPRNKMLHYGGLTRASHYDFGKEFARRFGYDPKLVIPSRPAAQSGRSESALIDYSLNSTAAVEMLKIKPFLLEESLDLLKQHLVPGL